MRRESPLPSDAGSSLATISQARAAAAPGEGGTALTAELEPQAERAASADSVRTPANAALRLEMYDGAGQRAGDPVHRLDPRDDELA